MFGVQELGTRYILSWTTRKKELLYFAEDPEYPVMFSSGHEIDIFLQTMIEKTGNYNLIVVEFTQEFVDATLISYLKL